MNMIKWSRISVALLFLCGCESMKPEGFRFTGTSISLDGDRMLHEPDRVADYAPFVFPALRRIEEVPSHIEFSSDVEYAIITKRMLWGTTQKVATVPVRKLIKGQFLHAVSEHFHPLSDGRRSAVRIMVDVLGVVITREEQSVSSRVTLGIKIEDIARNHICYEKTYVGTSSREWSDITLVPESVYHAVQNCTSEFLRDVAGNSQLIARLEDVAPDAKSVRRPEFLQFELKPADSAGVVRGVCRAKCNDWDEGRVAGWLRGQLERRCENQLGVESARVRVVYESSAFNSENRTWDVSFAAFARSEMVLNYDSVTRSGTCVADLGLMGVGAEKAADRLKEYVLAEMDKRAGTVSSGDARAKAVVRFDAFKTDQKYNLIHCPFRLVY